jgi:hypothetical protein
LPDIGEFFYLSDEGFIGGLLVVELWHVVIQYALPVAKGVVRELFRSLL